MSNVKLSDSLRAVMFISTRNLPEDLENEVVKVITEKIKDKLCFVGRCFGRFDIVAEFDEESAKVASYKACLIQEEAANKLKEKAGENPVCSSLILCREFISRDKYVKDTGKVRPALKLYVFLHPKRTRIDLEEILGEIKKVNEELKKTDGEASLFYSSSIYTFVLTLSGNALCQIFEQFKNFRENTIKYFSESCTYVAIGLAEDGTLKDKECKKPVRAYVFVKLKKGFGDISIDSEIIRSINKRFGWSDISVEVEAPTLYQLKKEILNWRIKYGEIERTSTLLLPEGRMKNEGFVD